MSFLPEAKPAPTPGLPPYSDYNTVYEYADDLISIAKLRGEPVFAKWYDDIIEIGPDDTAASFKDRWIDTKQMNINECIADALVRRRLPKLISVHENEKQALVDHLKWCTMYSRVASDDRIFSDFPCIVEALKRHGFSAPGQHERFDEDDPCGAARYMIGVLIAAKSCFDFQFRSKIAWMENWLAKMRKT